METKSEVNRDQQLDTMEQHLDDIIFDLVQTIQSFEDMGANQFSNLICSLGQAKASVISAMDTMKKDCK